MQHLQLVVRDVQDAMATNSETMKDSRWKGRQTISFQMQITYDGRFPGGTGVKQSSGKSHDSIVSQVHSVNVILLQKITKKSLWQLCQMVSTQGNRSYSLVGTPCNECIWQNFCDVEIRQVELKHIRDTLRNIAGGNHAAFEQKRCWRNS